MGGHKLSTSLVLGPLLAFVACLPVGAGHDPRKLKVGADAWLHFMLLTMCVQQATSARGVHRHYVHLLMMQAASAEILKRVHRATVHPPAKDADCQCSIQPSCLSTCRCWKRLLSSWMSALRALRCA